MELFTKCMTQCDFKGYDRFPPNYADRDRGYIDRAYGMGPGYVGREPVRFLIYI